MAQFTRVFIAEKPSLAETIALALAEMGGVKASKIDGYWDVGKDAVTWLYGHVYESAEPAAYGEKWASGGMANLPIIVAEKDWKKTLPGKGKDKDKDNFNERVRVQVGKVKALAKAAQGIVNCGDPGREGQLLVDEALIEMGIDPFSASSKRLWVQSMARKEMIAGLNALKQNLEKKSLYEAAFCRQRADWQHGMTFSRLYSSLARNSGTDAKISVGRVQTPTLRLIVDRDRERANFKAVDHFLPKITFKHENGTFTAAWVIPADYDGVDSEGRLIDRKVAEALVSRISGKEGRVKSVKSENKFVAPPLPYSLTTLQAECSSKFGMTAKETLDTAQALYDKHKALSYPRTECNYLPEGVLTAEAPAIMRALGATQGLEEAVKAADMGLRSGAWNTSKVGEHYGIIPTLEFNASKLGQMTPMERDVFLLVSRAFICQFYPPYKYKAMTAEVSCEGESFKAGGRQILDRGWKSVAGAADSDDSENEIEADEAKQALPTMAQGDPVTGVKGDSSSKRTSPPPAFNDGTLITAMANVHRFVTNPDVKKRLKETDGIGTVATRDATIETLIKRNFVKREGKNTLKSTMFGQSVVDVLPEELKDPGLTALWEGALQQVQGGSLPSDEFMGRQSTFLIDQVNAAKGTTIVLKGAPVTKPIDGHGESCPNCSKGMMVTIEIKQGEHKGKKFLSCSNKPDCDYKRWPQAKVDPIAGHGKDCPACNKGKLLTKEITSKKPGPTLGKKYVLLACSNYPECKHGEWPERAPQAPVPPIEGHGKSCPQCSVGKMETKEITSKKPGPTLGKKYSLLECTNYPACKHSEWPARPPQAAVTPIEGHGKTCTKCNVGQMNTKEITSTKPGPNMDKKYTLLECSNYPACKNSEWPARSDDATASNQQAGRVKVSEKSGSRR